MINLKAHQVSLKLGQQWVLERISLSLDTPRVVGLLGPNGAGKSSLLRLLYRALRPAAGWVELAGKNLWHYTGREAARRLAVVSQDSAQEPGFTVLEMVLMGRTPHKSWFEPDTPADIQMAREALARVGLDALLQRPYQTLSGGEKQRVLIARALAQRARILLMDEPTNHLDVRYQLDVLHLVRDLGLPAVLALHDLNLAAMFCDHLVLLSAGRVVTEGPPEAVLTPENLWAVYRVKARIETHPTTQRPLVVLLPPEAS